jgi:putative multiple sugar transport system permease protein
MTFLTDMQKALRENIREYGMFVALLVIMVVFSITTKGLFISSRNIVNLVNQSGYIAVLAVGMTLVIIIQHIDLSVGFLAGFLGAVVAIAMTQWDLPVGAAILFVLACGLLAGVLTGFLVAQLGIPSFVATLAGWLGYRGALQLVTISTGTIIIPNETFNAIGNGFIPDIPGLGGFLPGLHKLTLLIGLLGIILFIGGAVNDRRKTQAYHFGVLPLDIFIVQMVIMSALIGGISWILAGYQGLSWTAVVIIVVALFYQFIMTRTTLGRHIYAVGGNPQAAELSGISVKRMTYVVFASMGLLTALSGILFASRLRSATTTAGTLFELDAIAAAFVGGASAAGGVGNVLGSIIGALVMASLTNGMNLMGIDLSLQFIVRALVLAAAVIFDVTTRGKE